MWIVSTALKASFLDTQHKGLDPFDDGQLEAFTGALSFVLPIKKYFASGSKDMAHVLKKLKVLDKRYQQLFRDADVIDWALPFATPDLLDFKPSSQDLTDESSPSPHALSYCSSSTACYTLDYTSVTTIDTTVSVSQTGHREEKNSQSYSSVTVSAAPAVSPALRACSLMRLIRKWFHKDKRLRRSGC